MSAPLAVGVLAVALLALCGLFALAVVWSADRIARRRDVDGRDGAGRAVGDVRPGVEIAGAQQVGGRNG
jgi:hypothetical protein